MYNVVLDDSVEDVATDETELAIHRRQSTFRVRPGRILEVGHIRMRVVQERDCHQPVVYPEIRHTVEQEDSRPASHVGNRLQSKDYGRQAKGRQAYEKSL